MRMNRLAGLVLALALLGCALAQAALAADEAGPIYEPGQVLFINLTLSPTEKAKLEAKPDEYVIGTFSMTKSADGTPSGAEVPFVPSRTAEIRLKGNAGGSFRDLSKKAAFKLKFKKTEAVLGLRKMTLNNMVQDPSMLHETLAYAAFRAAGVPASRTGYAYVRLNGEDIGVYLDLENLDEIGLARIFGSFDKNTQHLYEGEDGHDVTPGEAAEFEVDEGPPDITDLENLIEVVNASPGASESWSQHVAARVNLAEMTKMWAVEKYIDHWDGYSGHAEAGLRPNNYYLFSEPSGRFQMLPWGADQTWIPTKGVPNREVTFDGEGGVLFDKCLGDKACFRLYWEALQTVTTEIATFGPQALAESTATMLAPWQAEEIAHGRPEYDATEIKEGSFGVDETIEFIEGRQMEAEEWLAGNEPPPKPETVEPVGHASGLSPQTTGHSGPWLLFERAKRSGRRLTTRVQLSGPGKVSLQATFRSGKKHEQACAASKRSQAPGGLALHCTLSSTARERVAHRPLRLELTFTITPVAGGKETVMRSIRLARS